MWRTFFEERCGGAGAARGFAAAAARCCAACELHSQQVYAPRVDGTALQVDVCLFKTFQRSPEPPRNGMLSGKIPKKMSGAKLWCEPHAIVHHAWMHETCSIWQL